MIDPSKIAIIIPALNEEANIGEAVRTIPSGVGDVIVVDNGSTDETAQNAAAAGAMVVSHPKRGYGAACLAGVAALKAKPVQEAPFVTVFMDGDLSDDASELFNLVGPIFDEDFDLVIGSRVKGDLEPGALTTTQRFGNRLCCGLIKSLFNVAYTDLGPFRAIKWSSLEKLEMDNTAYGWTIQMQVRAAAMGMKIKEIPVTYRQRKGGKSKVSGTIKGIVSAGATFMYIIIKEAYRAKRALS